MTYQRRDVPHGIMFHHFHDGNKHPQSKGSISADEFAKLLDFIGIERILSPGEWLEKLDKNTLSGNDLCLTFDDALLCQIDIALPVLEHYHLTAFWFVYSGVFEGALENLEIYRLFRTKYFDSIDDFYNVFLKKVSDLRMAVDIDPVQEERDQKEKQKLYPFQSATDNRFRFFRDIVLGKEKYEQVMDLLLAEHGLHKPNLAKNLWMTDKDLLYLSNHEHNIGLHSYSHPTALAMLSGKEQGDEYQKNYAHVARATGIYPVAVAHPCNSYNNETLTILHQLSIRCGFRSNMFPAQEALGLNASNLEFAREDHANIMIMLRK
ncbi:MAG TPA: polysaccharide deacetylase family protein [Candidatus Paceibacterota bacterium]